MDRFDTEPIFVVARSRTIRLTTQQRGKHHVTVPRHSPMRVGTLGSILADVADHFGMTRDTLMDLLLS